MLREKRERLIVERRQAVAQQRRLTIAEDGAENGLGGDGPVEDSLPPDRRGQRDRHEFAAVLRRRLREQRSEALRVVRQPRQAGAHARAVRSRIEVERSRERGGTARDRYVFGNRRPSGEPDLKCRYNRATQDELPQGQISQGAHIISMASTNYTAKDITVLEGLEPVRKRPGMYIGGVGSAGLHHLVWEILDNAVDEAMNGFASNIWVTLHADGSSITIEDDGRGIPIDKHPGSKKSAVETVFTVLHAGGKFEHGSYKTAGGLHGVGASVVNALSKELVATVKRDGAQWEMRFKQGKPVSGLKKIGPARGTGTSVYFHPDAAIFPKIEFDAQIIRERLEVVSYLHKGIKVVFEDEAARAKLVYEHSEGLVDYLKKI